MGEVRWYLPRLWYSQTMQANKVGAALSIALSGLATAAVAQDTLPPGGRNSWYVAAGPVFGQPIIGSEDSRRGQVYYVGKSTYSRQLSTNKVPAQIVVELYFNNTIGGGYEADVPINILHMYGFTIAGRWYLSWLSRQRIYAQFGLGLAYGNHATVDLDSLVNSTPYLAIGTTWMMGRTRFMAEARFFHISNGGTDGHNQGSNQLQYLIGVQF